MTIASRSRSLSHPLGIPMICLKMKPSDSNSWVTGLPALGQK